MTHHAKSCNGFSTRNFHLHKTLGIHVSFTFFTTRVKKLPKRLFLKIKNAHTKSCQFNEKLYVDINTEPESVSRKRQWFVLNVMPNVWRSKDISPSFWCSHINIINEKLKLVNFLTSIYVIIRYAYLRSTPGAFKNEFKRQNVSKRSTCGNCHILNKNQDVKAAKYNAAKFVCHTNGLSLRRKSWECTRCFKQLASLSLNAYRSCRNYSLHATSLSFQTPTTGTYLYSLRAK